MHHLEGKKNLALLATRQITAPPFNHILVTRLVSEMKTCSHDRGTNCFPLYLSDNSSNLSLNGSKRLNFSAQFLRGLSQALGRGAKQANGLPKGITAEEVFYYAYAVFYDPIYRSRYAECLKTEFPRLPLTSNLSLFRTLAQLGGKLVSSHLFEAPRLDLHRHEFVGGRTPEVEKSSWNNNTVWINKKQTVGFRNVPEAVWNFHVGGYQVCEKWLKDRKGRTLSPEDIAHYQKIIATLSETLRLMGEIEAVVEEHGGWPGAFTTMEAEA
jgi:predicted helicase